MRKFLLMLFLLFSFSFFAYGQDTDVDGTVTVEETYDEFTQITWYEPKYVSDKDSTYFPNISCYAGRQGESNILRLKIMYMGESWLFIESFYLLYDGVVKKVNFKRILKENNYAISLVNWSYGCRRHSLCCVKACRRR